MSYETGDNLEELPILKLSRHREKHYNVVVDKHEKNRGHIGNHSDVKNIFLFIFMMKKRRERERERDFYDHKNIFF